MVLLNKNQHTEFYAAMIPLGLPPISNLQYLNIPSQTWASENLRSHDFFKKHEVWLSIFFYILD